MKIDLYQFVFDFFVDEFIGYRRQNKIDESKNVLPILFQFWLIDSDQTRRAIIMNQLRRFFEIRQVLKELQEFDRDSGSLKTSINWVFNQQAFCYDEIERNFFEGSIGINNDVNQRFFEILTTIIPERALDK